MNLQIDAQTIKRGLLEYFKVPEVIKEFLLQREREAGRRLGQLRPGHNGPCGFLSKSTFFYRYLESKIKSHYRGIFKFLETISIVQGLAGRVVT